MIVKIKTGNNGSGISLRASKKKINGRYVWRIVFPKNETIFIAQFGGRCKPVGKMILSDDLLDEIGFKLNPSLLTQTLNFLVVNNKRTY